MHKNNKKPNPFISLWLKPRETIRSLEDRSQLFHFLTHAGLAFLYSIQLCLIMCLTLPDHAIFKPQIPFGQKLLVISIATGSLLYFFGIYAPSWFIWIPARLLGGRGKIGTTKREPFLGVHKATLWALICWLPASSCALLLAATYTYSTLCAVIFGIGVLISLVYALGMLVIITSEAHQFSLLHALVSIIGACYLVAFCCLWIKGHHAPIKTRAIVFNDPRFSPHRYYSYLW